MFSGFKIEMRDENRFVIPAILPDAIAKMVRKLQDTDPQDRFTVVVEWVELPFRPDYTI